MTKRKSFIAILAFVFALCLTISMGRLAYATEDNLPPTIVAIGGNTVQDGIATLPSAIMGESYKDKDGEN